MVEYVVPDPVGMKIPPELKSQPISTAMRYPPR
jgi:hypothetical protein